MGIMGVTFTITHLAPQETLCPPGRNFGLGGAWIATQFLARDLPYHGW
jgi:hypothetical protein